MLERAILDRLSKLITIEDVKDIFDVQTDATIHKWRTETDFGDFEIRIPGRGRDVIRFELEDVMGWAKRHKRDMPGLKAWWQKYRANE